MSRMSASTSMAPGPDQYNERCYRKYCPSSPGGKKSGPTSTTATTTTTVGEITSLPGSTLTSSLRPSTTTMAPSTTTMTSTTKMTSTTTMTPAAAEEQVTGKASSHCLVQVVPATLLTVWATMGLIS